MKTNYLLALIVALVSFDTCSHELSSDEYPLEQILEKYSELHGTKFVQDPRVRAIVTSSGIDLKEIDQVTLMRMLLMHDFIALEKNGVVYIMPRVSGEALGKEYGNIWGEQ